MSCTEKDKKDAGAVHVWRIDADAEDVKPRQYIGCVVDPADTSVTSAFPLPRAIAIFPEKKYALFRFFLIVEDRSSLYTTGLRLDHRKDIESFSDANRRFVLIASK